MLAFNLYCKIPFGTIHMRNPQIIDLAGILGRSVGAVSYKLANFARLDPTLQSRGIRGMTHGAKGEAEIWEEFGADGEKLTYESEKLLAERTGTSVERLAEIDERELPAEGLERERLVKNARQPALFPRGSARGLRFSLLRERSCGPAAAGCQSHRALVARREEPNESTERPLPQCSSRSRFRPWIDDDHRQFQSEDQPRLEADPEGGRRTDPLAAAVRRSCRHVAEEVSAGRGVPQHLIANAGSARESATMNLVAVHKLGLNRNSS